MRLANIFGLHIGCRVKCKRYDEVGELYSISGTICKIFFKSDETAEYIKDCKLILKPLSKITDEGKAEFEKLFMNGKRIEKIYTDNNLVYVVVAPMGGRSEVEKLYDKHFPKTGICTVEDCAWLASKGYDIGLVPDEYKEVEQ